MEFNYLDEIVSKFLLEQATILELHNCLHVLYRFYKGPTKIGCVSSCHYTWVGLQC